MGTCASCNQIDTASDDTEIRTRPSHGKQPRANESCMKQNISIGAGTSKTSKSHVQFREEKEEEELEEDDDGDDDDMKENDSVLHPVTQKTQRPGLLPPIELSDKSNIDQQASKRNPKKRKQYDMKMQMRIKELEEEISSLRSEFIRMTRQHYDERETLKQEADDLKLRLSKLASDRLTNNNPNITDLSDENRAIKIGEKFSELYSNEWSDAFEDLIGECKRCEREAIDILLDILKTIYEECNRKAEQEILDIKTAILTCTGHSEMNNRLTQTVKLFRTDRKKNFEATTPDLLTTLEALFPNYKERATLQSYVRTATETCWLMCIHEPPLTFKYCGENDKFNEEYFSLYTRTGDTVEFLVWPALLLHHGGPLLKKGVAQAKSHEQKE